MKSMCIALVLFLCLLGCDQKVPTRAKVDAPATMDVKVPKDAKVFFVSPKDGAKLKSPVKVVMGIEGMKIEASGDIKENSGHHHIIVDKGHIKKGHIVPKDVQHLHYGKAQSEAEVTLTPGKHTLTLQVANGAHFSYGEKLSATITVEIEK